MAELLLGMFLLFGAFTQYMALMLLLYTVIMSVLRQLLPHPSHPSSTTLLLLASAGCSLFITGAGVFAVDLPI
jgi:hypothetical protein